MGRVFSPALILLILYTSKIPGQVSQSLSDRPGTFEILSRTDYTTSDCRFTKSDVTANLERIKDVIAVVRQNPVLTDIRGFNGRARIYTMSMTCKEKYWYGVPSRISFEFSSFFLSKDGQVRFNTIEPPEWSLYINDLIPGGSDSFNTKHGYFTVPLKKETIKSGIDVYDDEFWVIYDPERPPYWLPVTVEEAFTAAREEISNEKDETAAKYMNEMFNQEYSAIPSGDLNKPAFFGGNLSRVSSTSGYGGQENLFPRIMKVNPEYFNQNLARPAVQFIYFRSVRNKQYMKQRLDECIQNSRKGSGSGCDLARFELSFSITDISNLREVIGR